MTGPEEQVLNRKEQRAVAQSELQVLAQSIGGSAARLVEREGAQVLRSMFPERAAQARVPSLTASQTRDSLRERLVQQLNQDRHAPVASQLSGVIARRRETESLDREDRAWLRVAGRDINPRTGEDRLAFLDTFEVPQEAIPPARRLRPGERPFATAAAEAIQRANEQAALVGSVQRTQAPRRHGMQAYDLSLHGPNVESQYRVEVAGVIPRNTNVWELIRRAEHTVPDQNSSYQLITSTETAAGGQSFVTFTVTDRSGQPLTGAALDQFYSRMQIVSDVAGQSHTRRTADRRFSADMSMVAD